MALAFVGGFWLTRFAMEKIGGNDEENQIEVWNERIGQQPQTGDIIFQTSTSAQSFAIQEATYSKFSHVGLIEEINGNYFVFEAVQPVKRTALQEWIDRGEDSNYVIKRLEKFEYLETEKGKEHWKQVTEFYLGKDYDSKFEWSDDKMYCSELVWKLFNELAGVELGALQSLSELDIDSQPVGKKLVERFGDNIPWEQKVISPKAIFDSPLLLEVVSTY